MKHLVNNSLLEFENVGSTNKVAAKILAAGKPVEGTVIITQFQSQGVGLGTNTWESQPGKNLLMSLILYPTFLEPARQFLLHKISSLAVMDTVRVLTQTEEITIKWPNDIYAGNKKIAGTLTNNIIAGNLIKSSVVGIGLNINQVTFSENLPNPVSMKMITGKTFEVKKVLNLLCEKIDHYYDLLKNNQVQLIDDLYLKSLLNYQVDANYKTGDEVFSGRIFNVSEYGKLQIMHGSRLREFDIKEIEYLLFG
ncbi:MAG: biotin--[acetyl-CoA-carboxylase] ligase [Bacteroidetes bacterium 4484_276]|nr:MAG: biotin--[acetyl-CoA-carboxylase] ligase [Bacteroidetes bacterium 4484_276]